MEDWEACGGLFLALLPLGRSKGSYESRLIELSTEEPIDKQRSYNGGEYPSTLRT